jgi:N-acyl-L-homoserine lactone synthetase
MFLTLDHASLERAPGIRTSMLNDRAQQFVARHKWPLELDSEGLEVDEYDDALTTYCVVAEAGRHIASVRLRPAAAGSMVEKHFPELWRGVAAELGGGVEITRFCAAPALSADERLMAVSDLLLGLCRHCQRAGIDSFFGVVFPAAARVIRQGGWPGTVLNATARTDGNLILAEWRPSNLVAWMIQERRELREEIWWRMREARRLAA